MISECQATCGICSEINGSCSVDGYKELVTSKKNIISESESFLLIPSLGPLNESHIMLVPKNHSNSFASLSIAERKEAHSFLVQVNNFIKNKTSKDLIFFESGAGKRIDHSGGCIYHAHIHCVYASEAFTAALNREIKFTPADSFDYDIDRGYVWYMNHFGEEFACNNPLLPSQFLRYLYANTTSIHGSWNWRRDNNMPGVLRVLKRYDDFSL